MQVREFQDGCQVDQCVLVRSAELRRRHNGDELLKLAVGDRTGTVTAILSRGAAPARELCTTGTPIRVTGRFSIHERYGPQLTLDSLRLAEPDEYDITDLRDGPARSVMQMEADLRELLATIHNPHLCALLELVFGEHSPIWADYRDAPAAKHYHQAYRHGLLEHSLSVAQSVSAISATFGGVDREIAVTGALLHDIGKLEAYETHGDSISMSDDGRLYGEIRARLLPRSPCDRGARRVPAATGAGRAAHRPQPPRLARAWQPGGPMHARGDVRAHDRQPRRQAR